MKATLARVVGRMVLDFASVIVRGLQGLTINLLAICAGFENLNLQQCVQILVELKTQTNGMMMAGV